eukprot:CAMPEP_0119541914 /NCGR_PEP_ID=MMETSP1344-20130328/53251_1 /TAXON_ID=236787 /ORGANISM="Florenciella parvula, Strain CCMP2471" /LENGTH=784 /DNA_ID=CAMNT_0007586015 /DNA_START=147 /DNA_END=2498 /DNA_ORIENTATION=-
MVSQGYLPVMEHEDDVQSIQDATSRKRMRMLGVLAAVGAVALVANQSGTTRVTSAISWPWTVGEGAAPATSTPPEIVAGNFAASDSNDNRGRTASSSTASKSTSSSSTSSKSNSNSNSNSNSDAHTSSTQSESAGAGAGARASTKAGSGKSKKGSESKASNVKSPPCSESDCPQQFGSVLLHDTESKGGRDGSELEGLEYEYDSTRPHIVNVLIDDMGHNDIGYNNKDGDVWTPAMDELAAGGITMARYYTQFTCTPSRAAMLTAKYPIHTGLQHGQIFYNEPWGLPLTHSILPEYLKEFGYTSHIVGKWHLGHYNDASLPTSRGFDSFFGMLDGAQFYSTHVDAMQCTLPGTLLYNGAEDYDTAFTEITSKGCYFDLHQDNETAPGYFGVYNTFLFRDRAIQILREHDVREPLFLYLAFNAVHSPVSSPHETYSMYPEIKNIVHPERKRFAAALRLVDDAVADLVSTLKEEALYDNTLLIISSDNGANPENGGSNAPLRGSKGYLFEGGMRVPAFVHSPSLIPEAKAGTTYYGMFHIVDWLPTIVEGVMQAQVNPELVYSGGPNGLGEDRQLDGMSHWDALVGGAPPPREEMLLNIDYLDGSLAYGSQPLGYDTAALVHGPWKLIVNSGELDWYETPDTIDGAVSLFSSEVVNPHTYLFNVVDDPEERTNVAEAYPHTVDRLLERIAYYRSSMVTCEWRGDDVKAMHTVHSTGGGFIGPWYEADEMPPKSSNCQDGFEIKNKDASFIKSNIGRTFNTEFVEKLKVGDAGATAASEGAAAGEEG